MIGIAVIVLRTGVRDPLPRLAAASAAGASERLLADAGVLPVPVPSDVLTISRPDAPTTAALRNAAVAATGASAFLFLDDGVELPGGALAAAAAALETDPNAALAVFAQEIHFPWETRCLPPPGGLSDVLADTDVPGPAVVVRRATFDAVGGFNEELTCHEVWELAIRLHRHGARVAPLPGHTVVFRPGESPLWRRNLERDRHLPSVLAVVRANREAFAEDPVVSLAERERRVHVLGERHREAEARRDARRREIATLDEEIRSLSKELRGRGLERVDWGDLRRIVPISPIWGDDRGRPVDRRYIENFLETHRADIRGRVLEVGDTDYTRRFGAEAAERADAVDVEVANARANVLADLRHSVTIPDNAYDCVILCQTLHVIDDIGAAIGECRRILRPGGVLLATLPSVSRVCLEYGVDGDFWRVTEAGARWLFRRHFGGGELRVTGFGNVMITTAFTYGLSQEEVDETDRAAWDAYDPWNPTLIAVRAVKPGVPAKARPAPDALGAVLMFHRIAAVERDPHRLCIAPDRFERFVERLAREATVLELDELARASRDDRLPPGAVALTFDDGYVDALTVAAPILARYGLPATFFVTAEPLERDAEYWWDTLERILLGRPELPPSLRLDLGSGPEALDTGTGAARAATHDRLHELLVTASVPVRDAVIRDLRRWSADAGPPPDGPRPMNAAELRRLGELPGVTIGAHGVHHVSLPAQRFDAARGEIIDARFALERQLGRPVQCFAFPFGHHDEVAVELVRAAGFRVAVTCIERLLRRWEDSLRLPRLEMRSDTLDEAASRISSLGRSE